MPGFEHDDCDEVLIGPMWKRERMVLGLKRSERYLMAAEAQKFHSALPDVSEAMSPPVTPDFKKYGCGSKRKWEDLAYVWRRKLRQWAAWWTHVNSE